jgi:hypothetical protein
VPDGSSPPRTPPRTHLDPRVYGSSTVVIPTLPHTGREGLPRRRAAPGDGQLRRAQTRRGAPLARGESSRTRALHPTSASWMNLVEVWFGTIDRQASHRGHLRLGARAQRHDPRLHRRLERPLPPRSSGQSRQTKSWPRRTVRTLQKRLTSSSFAIDSPRSRPARGTASHSDRAIAVGCTKGSAPSPVVAVESGWGMVRTTCGTH